MVTVTARAQEVRVGGGARDTESDEETIHGYGTWKLEGSFQF